MGFLDRLRGKTETSPTEAKGGSARPRSGVLSIPLRVELPSDARFTFLETVDYDSSYDDPEMHGYNAMERRTGAKFRVWRDDQDRVLFTDELSGTQPLLPISDTVYHRRSGVIAAAGFGRSEFYEDPSIHEFREDVWVRPAGETQFVRIAVAGDPWAIDIAPDGASVACLSWLGSSNGGALCTTIDTRTCEHRALTLVKLADGKDLYGGEEIRISPDGSWLLLNTSGDQEAVTIIEAQTGRTIRIPLRGVRTAGWWPQRSPSSLLVGWIGAQRQTTLGALDLASGDLIELGVLELPPEVRDDTDYAFGVERLSVGPDGRSLLGVSFVASDQAWSMARRPRGRIARGELFPEPTGGGAGRIVTLAEAFLADGAAAVVEQIRPHWIDPTPGMAVEFAPQLLANARDPVTANEMQ